MSIQNKTNYPVVGTFKRLIQYIIDWYFCSMIVELMIALVSKLFTGETLLTEYGMLFPDNISNMALWTFCLFSLLAITIYYSGLIPYLINRKYGFRTIGNLIMKTVVVDKNIHPADAKKYMFRTLLLFEVVQLAYCGLYTPVRTVLEIYLDRSIAIIVLGIPLVIGLVSDFMCLRSVDKQCLHDKFSGCYIVPTSAVDKYLLK